MSRNHEAKTADPQRLRTVRTLFAAILAVTLIAAVSITIWLIRRDTPSKAIRSTLKQFTSSGELVREILPDLDDTSSQPSLAALQKFFEPFSCKILSVTADNRTASADVRVTTPDTQMLASDIRLFLLSESAPDTESAAPDSGQIYALMDRFLSEKEYPSMQTEGTITLTKEQDGWTILPDEDLYALLLGDLPRALSDPYLLTPAQVLTVYLEKLDAMSVQEWSDAFQVSDLFSTFWADSQQIDTEFLTRAKESYAYSDVQETVDGSHAEVSVRITGIDTSSILLNYREKLVRYSGTVSAIRDDDSALSEKSAQLLLEAIREAETPAEYPVRISMENNGEGWIITDSSALTDALFGGMADAVEQFGAD